MTDQDLRRRKGGGKRRRRRGEQAMVPDAEFTSYYGRPVVKASPWEADIPAYLFLGGLAGGSSLLAAGADLTGLPRQRRSARLVASAAIGGSLYALVHDLGRPARFHHMLRVAKVTSPMSVGTWILSAYGPFNALATGSELLGFMPGPVRNSRLGRLLGFAGRPGGLIAALIAPAVASYTAVLLTDTATPTWHAAQRELPFVFVGSAAAASGGMGLVAGPLGESGPARNLAVGGAVLELGASRIMQHSMGITAEPLRQGTAGTLHTAATALTAAGAAGAVAGRRSRIASALSGLALTAGSACTRFAIFHAGQASARDPRYTVVPQRERREGRSS
nr:NrfD/PsrC family molybdoenzyme membrane anchor subunit [Tomitella fengzijianii]